MNQQNSDTVIPDIPDKNVLVFGCGNILLGDDGFGPRVIEELLEKIESLEAKVYDLEAALKGRPE